MAFYKKRFRATYADLDPDEILADSVSVLGPAEYTEGKLEKPIGVLSYALLFIIVAIGMSYLTVRAFTLQVAQGQQLFLNSQENRFVVRPIYPPRGIVYDRFKQPLVENDPSFGLVFSKDQFVTDTRIEIDKEKKLKSVVDLLTTLLGRPHDFFIEAGFPADNAFARLPQQIFLTKGLSQNDIVSIAAHLNDLPGIQVYESFKRVYTHPYATSHVLGFVGQVSDTDVSRAKSSGSAGQAIIGKSGLELMYDEQLRGVGGKKIVEIDAGGKETRFKLIDAPQKGEDITTTLDGELQNISYDVFKNFTNGTKGGSVVILDAHSGAVRALVSYPGFDINKFGSALSTKEFDAVMRDRLHPLFNRAIAGEFPSGSVIKPMMAAAALQEHIIDPQKKIYDEGFITVPNPYKPGEKTKFVDWQKQGWINFYDAIAMSANVYFYTIGGGYGDQKGLGIQKIQEYAALFGLGSKLGIDLPGEKTGFFPGPESKPMLEPADPVWRIGDTYNVSIGQGGVRVTPLQMAVLTTAIANGGTLYRPHILEGPPYIIRDHLVSDDVLKNVVKGMRQTVTSGTARSLGDLPVEVAAKTGTAQAGDGLTHAWVTVFAPVENPELVVVVMAEHAGEGSSVSVPIAHEILKWYFTHTTRSQQ